jgi:hypothetical protein
MSVAIEQFHGTPVTDALDLEGFAQATVSLTTSAAQSTNPPGEGIYDIWTTADCYIMISPTATTVTVGNGYLLRTGNTITALIRRDCRLGGIVGTGTATLSYHKVG